MSQILPDVWVVILNWNGLNDTLACLESLEQVEYDAQRLHVLVVDNGSLEDPTDAITARFPRTRISRLAANRGFAGGCNIGILEALRAGAAYVLLLNNDTNVDPQFLKILVQYATAHPEAGAVAPLMCYADDRRKVWYAGATINMAFGYFEHRNVGRNRQSIAHQPFATDYASGCCLLIPLAAVRRIGVLDERFFAYFEDADYCLRLRQAGFSIVCVPESVIYHKESASTRKAGEGSTSPLKHFLMARNRIMTIGKHGSFWEFACFLLVGNPLRALFFLLTFTLRRRWKKLVCMFQGIADGLAHRTGEPVVIP